MAEFNNVFSAGNLGGGVYTNSSFSKFSDVTSIDNFGPGIIDDSANGSFEQSLADIVRQGASLQLANDFREQTAQLMAAVHNRDQSAGLKRYERLMALVGTHVTIFEPLTGPITRVMRSLGWL